MAKKFYKSIKQKQAAREAIRARGIMVADRNQEIINLRKLGMALEDIGDRYGISKERVRQIKRHTMLSLRLLYAYLVWLFRDISQLWRSGRNK